MVPTNFFIIFSIILLTFLSFGKSQLTYFNYYGLFRVTPQTKGDLKILKDIESSSDNYIFLNGVNIINENVDVLVALHRKNQFQEILKNQQILSKPLQVDFQNAVVNEKLITNQFSYKSYHNLKSIYDKLDAFEKEYPQKVKQIVIGKSWNGTEMRIIKLSNPSGRKPGIFVEGGTHGRAWISPATVIFIMEQLLISKDIVIQSLTENFDWYFMPVLNPDGYIFNERESIWNKNRSPQKNYCNGVDLNRNWNFNWHNSTSETILQKCLETYPGLYPFSEIETKLLSNFLIDLKTNGNLHLYLSFQSGVQQFFYPYGSTNEKTVNDEDLETISEVVVKALGQRRGTRYTYGSIFNAKYPLYGTSIDWVYGFLGIPLSFRWDLPNGEPTLRAVNQILPICEETFDSVVALITKAQSMGYFGKI